MVFFYQFHNRDSSLKRKRIKKRNSQTFKEFSCFILLILVQLVLLAYMYMWPSWSFSMFTHVHFVCKFQFQDKRQKTLKVIK